ncbi:hypothetical protein [Pseudonocardia spinosispora]|uniref:hypothetical protein n=1 Tax=Pseudonocardia spinosispora TaxID=103441 RepID=UPI00048D8DFC|nr:hypothetical protein [Pseudonocardia spinosispora]
MPCASATMAVWLSAWLSGAAAPDDVLDALEPWGEAHDVLTSDEPTALATDLPGPTDRPTSVTFLLAALRRLRGHGTPASVRMVLTAPGDIRGLPGPGPFSTSVIERGEGLLFADIGYGLIPQALGGGLTRWTLHPVPEPTPPEEYVSLREAEHSLREQVRNSAAALAALGVARHRPGVREEIADTLRARAHSFWPDGMPAHSLRVLQHADEVEAILLAASADDPGGALSATAAAARDDALRPLATAIRVARRAAVAEAVRVLVGSADRH